MKHSLLTMFISLSALGVGGALSATAQTDDFKYTNEQFADIQMLRYKVEGFEQLSLRQKTLIYHLSEAALAGRDILFDQNGRYNLRIREMLETVTTKATASRKTSKVSPSISNACGSQQASITTTATKSLFPNFLRNGCAPRLQALTIR